MQIWPAALQQPLALNTCMLNAQATHRPPRPCPRFCSSGHCCAAWGCCQLRVHTTCCVDHCCLQGPPDPAVARSSHNSRRQCTRKITFLSLTAVWTPSVGLPRQTEWQLLCRFKQIMPHILQQPRAFRLHAFTARSTCRGAKTMSPTLRQSLAPCLAAKANSAPQGHTDEVPHPAAARTVLGHC